MVHQPNQSPHAAISGARLIPRLVLVANATALIGTIVAEPAPRGIGPWEIVMGAASALALLTVTGAAFQAGRVPSHGGARLSLLLLTIFSLPLFQSMLVAWMRGTPLDAAFRAVAPYLVFVPIGLAGVVMPGLRGRVSAVRLLVIAGAVQAGYLLSLYFAIGSGRADASAVRLARITFLDPRTTSPLVLACAVLPWALIPAARSTSRRGFMAALGAVGLFAVASTQTRSMLVAAGGGVILVVAVVAGLGSTGPTRFSIGRAAGAVAALLTLGIGVGAAIPQVRALAGAIAIRAEQEGDSGRIEDEWVPAVATLLDAGAAGVAFGIGSGESFVTTSGEERTYVHNLTIYSLLYFGVVGLLAMATFYLVLFGRLFRTGAERADPRLLGLMALVASLFVYAQFFAVHKLLSYNLILMLAVQVIGARREDAGGPWR